MMIPKTPAFFQTIVNWKREKDLFFLLRLWCEDKRLSQPHASVATHMALPTRSFGLVRRGCPAKADLGDKL